MFVAWWCILAAVVGAATAQVLGTPGEPFTLPDFVGGQFSQRGFNGRWISDHEFTFTRAGEPGIYAYDVSTLTDRVLVPGSLMEQLNTNNPVLSPNERFILASSQVEQVYRYSTTAIFSLYNVNGLQAPVPVANGARLQLCIFGGLEHALAYVLDNDVYYQPPDGTAIRITTDGIPGVYYNGHADWVYEEDVMYTGQATWFSTGGSYLAFATYDDREVDSYSYYYYDTKNHDEDPYPDLKDLKYPKVGHKNPTVLLRIVDLRTLTPTNINFINVSPPTGVTSDHILGGVLWVSDTEIAMHWQNRRQNYSVLQICNVNALNNCAEEPRSQPNGWIPLALPRFSTRGDFFLSTRWSEPQTDGQIWQHLYLSVRVGNQIMSSSITPGAFTVNNYVGMDEDNVLYYYTRTVPDQPWESQVHVAGAATGCLSCNIVMPDGGRCAWAVATVSLGGRYMSITCSSPNEPSAVFLYDPRERRVLSTWEDNAVVRQRLQGKARWGSIIDTVPLQNGFPAPVRLLLPPGLDINDTTTKYPMVFYVYSGPNTNTVYNTFTVGYHSYLTTSRNVIYMMADGRGSGLKGQDILFSLNNALGTVEIEDHFVILRQVLARYQFIDADRVGMWGHSYGGYATLLSLVHDDNHMLQCGISTAPVTSWIYYNTMYTERYMGLPTPEDNQKGYEDGDVTLLAEKLRGHNLLLMHGNADDNVHFQNAAKLMTALQQADIPFDQMSYPDEAHSLVGVNLHRYNAMDRYWTKCLPL